MPGGPISVRIAPERLSSAMPAVGAQLAHGQVLRDAVLDVLEAGVVGVEHLARAPRDRASRRSARPTARRSASPGRTGSSTPRPTARPCARAGRAPSWPARAPRRACRTRRSCVRYSSATEPESSPSSRWIDSICLRRKYSRCCVSAPDCTSSRIFLRSCSSVSRSRWILTASSSRSVTSSGLEDLDLLLEGDVGRVADRVGQGAGLDDRAQERRRRARRRRAARGSPRPRRGTRARPRGCARRRGCRRGARPPRRAGGRGSRCGRRRRRRGRRRRARRRGRRPAGARRSVTSAMVPTFANSPSWRGTSRTRVSSPTSTGSVTSIVGKTTVSSRGTRSNEVMSEASPSVGTYLSYAEG